MCMWVSYVFLIKLRYTKIVGYRTVFVIKMLGPGILVFYKARQVEKLALVCARVGLSWNGHINHV